MTPPTFDPVHLKLAKLAARVRDVLTRRDDLRRPPWRGSENPLAGHCYVAAEALHFLLGPDPKFRPMFVRHEGQPHWFLQDDQGGVLDPTVSQFKFLPNYKTARGKGFLTSRPSKRCLEVVREMALTSSTRSW